MFSLLYRLDKRKNWANFIRYISTHFAWLKFLYTTDDNVVTSIIIHITAAYFFMYNISNCGIYERLQREYIRWISILPTGEILTFLQLSSWSQNKSSLFFLALMLDQRIAWTVAHPYFVRLQYGAEGKSAGLKVNKRNF